MSGYLYNIVNILNPLNFGGFVNNNIKNLTEVFYGSFNVVKNYLYADSGSNDIVNVELTGLDHDVVLADVSLTATIDTAPQPPIFYLTNRFVEMDDDDYDDIDILIDGDDDRASTVKTPFNGSIIKLKIYNDFDLSIEANKIIIYNLVENVKDLPSTSIKQPAITEVTTFLSSSSTSSTSSAVSLQGQLVALIDIIYNTFYEMAQIDNTLTGAKQQDIRNDIKNTIINFISYTNTYLGKQNYDSITKVVNQFNDYYNNIPVPHPDNSSPPSDDDEFFELQFKLKGSIIDLGISAIPHEGANKKMFYFKKLNGYTREVLKNKRCIHLMKTLFNRYYPSSTPSTDENVVFNRFIFGMFIKDFLINNTAQKTHRIAIEESITPQRINVYLVLSIATAHTNPPKSRVSKENRDKFFSSTAPPVGDDIFLYNDNWDKISNLNIVNGSDNHSYVSICDNSTDYQNKLTVLTNTFKSKPYTDLNGVASIIDRYISICDKYHDIMTVDNKSTTLVNICSNYLNNIMILYSNKLISSIQPASLKKFIRDIMNKYTTNNNTSKFDKFEPLMVRFVLNWYKQSQPIKFSLDGGGSGGKMIVRSLLAKNEDNPIIMDSTGILPKIIGDDYVFNFDIMQPTPKIKNCYNNNNIDEHNTRKYLNSPEVIDGGHQYIFPEFVDHVNIEFPTNYKVSHFPLNPITTTFDIHSFSQTKKIGDEVYYIITIYFSITDPTTLRYLNFSVIHYINIVNAPSKNEIYDELNTVTNTKRIKNMITNINDKLTTITPPLTGENRNAITWAILDCILHGKSTQDEQNMLQVNERSIHDIVLPLNKPTNFIGICFDFMSTANGINLRYNPGKVTGDGVKNTGVIGYYKHNKSTNNHFVGIIGDEFYIINHTYEDKGAFISKCTNYFGIVSHTATAGATPPISGGPMIGGGTFNVKEKNDELLLTWREKNIEKEDYTKSLFFNSILTKSDDPNSMEIFKQMETFINPNEDDLIYLFDQMFTTGNDNILNFTRSIGMCNNTKIKGYTIMSNHYLSVLLMCLQESDENIQMSKDDVIKRVNDFFELNYVISDNIMIINDSLQSVKYKLITDIIALVGKNDVTPELNVVHDEDTEMKYETDKDEPMVVNDEDTDAETDEVIVKKRGLDLVRSVTQQPANKIMKIGGKMFTRRIHKNNNVGKYTRRKRNGKSVNKQRKTKRVNK